MWQVWLRSPRQDTTCIPGLCSLRGKFPLTVVLSPRNAQKAEKLRNEFPEIIRVANSTGDAKRFFSSFSFRWMTHRKWSCYFKEGIEMLRSSSEGIFHIRDLTRQIFVFEDCMFESGNQEVIDSSDCIMVAVLPSQAAMLSELRFRPGQQLVSLMAGLYPRQLRELCAVDMPISVVIP